MPIRFVDELHDRWKGRPGLVVAGGPTVSRCRYEDFAGWPTIGTNYAHRVWPVHFLVAVKPYIRDEVEQEIDPERVVAPWEWEETDKDGKRHVVRSTRHGNHHYEPCFELDAIGPGPTQSLYSAHAGATGTAIHLAHLMGCRPVFAIGCDLRMVRDEYHPVGYWDTTGFRPMGDFRRTRADVEPVFAAQAEALKEVKDRLRALGNALYFVNPHHWRHQS